MSSGKMPGSRQWVILSIMWLATFVCSYAQFQLPPLAGTIIPLLNLTNVQFASIITAPMIPAVLFSIIAGTLADRFGVKIVVIIGLIVATMGILFRVLAVNYWHMLILMSLAGFSGAFINANFSKILGAWFQPEQISKAMGIALTAGPLGMTLGMGTTALFPSANSAYITAGIVSIAATLLWMAFMKNKSEGAPESVPMPVLKYLLITAKCKPLWLVGCALMLILGCMMTFTGFLPKALSDIQGIDQITAGLLSSMVLLGTLISSLVSPIVSQRVGLYRPYLGAVGVLCAFGVFFAWQTQGILIWVAMILTGICLGAAMPIYMSFPLLLKEIGPVYAGSAGGLIATLQLIGAIVIPTYVITPLAGNDYNLIFGLAAGCMIIMSILVIFLPELGPKAKVSETGKVLDV